MAATKKDYTVEVASTDRDNLTSFTLKGYTARDISAVKRFLIDVDYYKATTIRILEDTDAQKDLEEKAS